MKHSVYIWMNIIITLIIINTMLKIIFKMLSWSLNLINFLLNKTFRHSSPIVLLAGSQANHFGPCSPSTNQLCCLFWFWKHNRMVISQCLSIPLMTNPPICGEFNIENTKFERMWRGIWEIEWDGYLFSKHGFIFNFGYPGYMIASEINIP